MVVNNSIDQYHFKISPVCDFRLLKTGYYVLTVPMLLVRARDQSSCAILVVHRQFLDGFPMPFRSLAEWSDVRSTVGVMTSDLDSCTKCCSEHKVNMINDH